MLFDNVPRPWVGQLFTERFGESPCVTISCNWPIAQGLKDKRRCCGCNILLAFRNGNATVTGGRSFARQGNDHFLEISKKLKKRTWLWIFTGTANGPIHPQNQPRKRKKPTGGPVGEESKNGGPFFYFPEKFSPPQNGEFFESQKEEHFHFSKNSP